MVAGSTLVLQALCREQTLTLTRMAPQGTLLLPLPLLAPMGCTAERHLPFVSRFQYTRLFSSRLVQAIGQE